MTDEPHAPVYGEGQPEGMMRLAPGDVVVIHDPDSAGTVEGVVEAIPQDDDGSYYLVVDYPLPDPTGSLIVDSAQGDYVAYVRRPVQTMISVQDREAFLKAFKRARGQ